MVSSLDIGRTVAKCMTENWEGKIIIELYGPEDYSPNDVAEAFGKALKNEVKAVFVPQASWLEVITKGWKLPENVAKDWIEMFDGFNSGLISFEEDKTVKVAGGVSLEEYINSICDNQNLI